MIEANLERLRAHRANIGRYCRLLATRLSDLERAYIKRRLNEEQASVEALLQETFPDRFSFEMDRGRSTNADMAALLHPSSNCGGPRVPSPPWKKAISGRSRSRRSLQASKSLSYARFKR